MRGPLESQSGQLHLVLARVCVHGQVDDRKSMKRCSWSLEIEYSNSLQRGSLAVDFLSGPEVG